MIFFYTHYEHILGQKNIISTLKNKEESENFDLYIITPAVKFLGLPIGGGMVKLSRLYTSKGELIHARNYSEEIKQEVKAFKKTLKIPFLKLWKGYLIILSVALVGSLIYGIKMKLDAGKNNDEIQKMTTNLQHLQQGQLYGVSFFTDAEGNSMNGLPAGWIRVDKIEGDTLFVRRSTQTYTQKVLFTMDDLTTIKPTDDSQWNDKIEKINYSLLKSQLDQEGKQRYDLQYIGSDYEKYRGVIMTIKGSE